MTTTTLAVLVPLLPFLGAAAGLLLGKTGYARPLAVLPTLAAGVIAVIVAVRQGGGRAIDAATQLTPTGSVPIDLALHLDGFAVLVAVLVTVVATCVQLYSTAYLRDDVFPTLDEHIGAVRRPALAPRALRHVGELEPHHVHAALAELGREVAQEGRLHPRAGAVREDEPQLPAAGTVVQQLGHGARVT